MPSSRPGFANRSGRRRLRERAAVVAAIGRERPAVLTERARLASSGVLEVVARRLERFGLTPNGVTVIGSGLHVVVAWLLASGQSVAAGLALAIVASFDAVDGTLARLSGQASGFGSFLDSTFDRVSEVILFVGIFLYFGPEATRIEELATIGALTGSLMVSYTRARSEGIGLGTSVGLFDRLVRTVVIVIACVTTQVLAGVVIVTIGAWSTAARRVADVARRSAPPSDTP